MNQGDTPKAEEDFETRLRRARGRDTAASDDAGQGIAGSGFGAAMRIGLEMVSALVVGVGLGLLLDNWLDTRPWFLVVFFFVGAAAGMLNVFRAAKGFGAAPGYRTEEPDKED